MSLRIVGKGQPKLQGPKDILCHAIASKLCVKAFEKNRQLKIAPHIVYQGHNDALMLDGVVVELDGKAPNKSKLEAFSVDDLGSLALTDRPFVAEVRFNPATANIQARQSVSLRWAIKALIERRRSRAFAATS